MEQHEFVSDDRQELPWHKEVGRYDSGKMHHDTDMFVSRRPRLPVTIDDFVLGKSSIDVEVHGSSQTEAKDADPEDDLMECVSARAGD